MNDDSITYFYPLVIALEDCFVPESAREVLNSVENLESEIVGGLITWFAHTKSLKCSLN